MMDQPHATAAASTAVDDDPQVRKAKLELELERVALDKARLALVDQSERAKLLKEIVPDFGSATVEKDASTASTTPPSLSENAIANAVNATADDIADLIIQAIIRREQQAGTNPELTLLVTSDTTHLNDWVARRDVLMRLGRVKAAITASCPAESTADAPQDKPAFLATQHISALTPFSALAPILSTFPAALPGAITLATRLFAHQYTTSSYSSALSGAVDLHTAGHLISRVRERPNTRVLAARLRPPTGTDLEKQLLGLAHDLDVRVADALASARIKAAVAAHHEAALTAQSVALTQRASDLFTAWKDKGGKSAASAGLIEDLAVIKTLETAIAATNDENKEEKNSLITVLTAVKARVDAVLKHLTDGEGDIGSEDLLEMLQTLDDQVRATATYCQRAQDQRARADEHVAKLVAVQTSGSELLEALASTDKNGDRLIEKVARASILEQDNTLVVFVRLCHGGADNVDDNRAGKDYRTTVGAATVEWALVAPDGAILDSGVRTVSTYLRQEFSNPDNSSTGTFNYTPIPRTNLGHPVNLSPDPGR